MNRPIVFTAITLGALLVAAGVIATVMLTQPPTIRTYAECVEQGYPTTTNHPSSCSGPNGKTFSEPGSTVTVTKSVAVYFSESPQSNQQFGYTSAVLRTTDRSDLERFVVEELIKGPIDTEKSDGLFSSLSTSLSGVSSCEGKDFELTIEQGHARLTFCRTIASAGAGDDARIVATIRDTLRQFSSITSLSIVDQNGNCLGSMNKSGCA